MRRWSYMELGYFEEGVDIVQVGGAAFLDREERDPEPKDDFPIGFRLPAPSDD